MIIHNKSEQPKGMPLDVEAETRLEIELMMHNGYGDDLAVLHMNALRSRALRLYAESGNRLVTPESDGAFAVRGLVLSDGRARVYPDFAPSTTFEVEVIDYRPLFEGQRDLLRVQANTKHFDVFLPHARLGQREDLVASRCNLRLALVTTDEVHVCNEEPPDIEWMAGKTGDPRYFSVEGKTLLSDYRQILHVHCPFDMTKKMELVASLKDYDDRPIDVGMIVSTRFFFIGSLGESTARAGLSKGASTYWSGL